MPTEQVVGSENTFRIYADKLDGGWSTRTIATQLPDSKLAIADNVVYAQDGLVSKRPGNILYGGGTGRTGSTLPILAMVRFYAANATTGTLYVHSGTALYRGNDTTGALNGVAGLTLSATVPARFTPMYDPDMTSGAATALFITDGVHQPQIFDGTNVAAVQTGGVFLPNGRAGAPITPLYSCNWDYHLCYAGQPDEPSALYISDALRPERFTGVNYIDSALSSYVPYFPAGRDGTLGPITGIFPLGPVLVIFYAQGIVVGANSGTYGATQYTFTRLSNVVGATAPRSIVSMDSFLIFFGGDRFYATDGQSLTPLADDLPTLYDHTSRSISPPEITNAATVFGVRRGSSYWASYDSTGGGPLGRVAVFDTSAAGGYVYPSTAVTTSSNYVAGGAWSRWPTGMPVGCAIECRGVGDNTTFPFFWGSSQGDVVAQHDTGVFSDFGAAITYEARSKSFYVERPLSLKTLQGAYVLCVFAVTGAPQVFSLAAYAVQDFQTIAAIAVPISIAGSGSVYGAGVLYGSGYTYTSAAGFTLAPIKVYSQQVGPCTAIGLGIIESSVNAFAIVGLILEVTIDAIAP